MSSLNWFELIVFLLDFYLAWLLVCWVLRLIKTNARAFQIIKGVLFVYVINIISQAFELTILNSLTSDIMTWGILAIIIIFQPEIRSGLEQVGRNRTWWRNSKNRSNIDLVDVFVEAFEVLSKEKTGALIVLEQKVSLDEFINPATPLQSIVTSELLRTIFMMKTPLHDGAAIVKNERVWCAGAILPSTKREDLDQTVGTRHRAAIGISEISDCIVLVISEESGKMSIAYQGELISFDKVFEFEQALRLRLKEGE